jgi:hypothetical protein
MQWLQIFTAVSPQTVRTSVATERLLVEATRQFCVMTEQLLRLRVAKTALAKSGGCCLHTIRDPLGLHYYVSATL